MEIFDSMLTGLGDLLVWPLPLWFLLGVLNGLVFGILPGLSGSVGIALMVPLTFSLDAGESMALFVAALSGQTFAGSITAILLNTPGTSPNAATTLDGYPLARQGRGGFAIGISATASALGSVVGVMVLIALLPVVREIILAFSFPEFALLALMGLAAIAAASSGSLVKGLISGGIGLLLSFVGFAPVAGELRYVFGIAQLWQGVDLIAALIGLFAISEVIRLLVRRESVAQDIDALRFPRKQVWEGVRFALSHPWLLIRSAVLGTGVGIVPGVGGTVASFLAYFQAVYSSKDRENFGRGDPRGVLAPEAANDGKDAGSALPSLAFGLPGSSDWAIILGALILHGINPGPNLIREAPEVVWIAVWVVLFASFATSIVGVLAAPYLVQVTRLRPSLIAPVVGVLAVVGAYALQRQFIDVIFALAFGVLGYYMRRHHIPVVPLILGLLLGETVERAMWQTLSVFDEGFMIFFTRPISVILIIVTVFIFVAPVLSTHRRSKQSVEIR
ncbi:MAG TPA: tripartite tricarboxylate transporter permease [Acidimicrobiia bacterium]|nr:tripartite tricarboxylate transporter permease [Acidimicrobiia bacterium]